MKLDRLVGLSIIGYFKRYSIEFSYDLENDNFR